MKAKIDGKLCIHCNFGDKGNILEGKAICISKVNGGNCRFDK